MTAFFFVHYAGPREWYLGEWDMGGGGLLLFCATELLPRTEDRISQLIFILAKHPHMLQTRLLGRF